MPYGQIRLKASVPTRSSKLNSYELTQRGARGVIVIVVGNEHGDTSSNPGRD